MSEIAMSAVPSPPPTPNPEHQEIKTEPLIKPKRRVSFALEPEIRLLKNEDDSDSESGMKIEDEKDSKDSKDLDDAPAKKPTLSQIANQIQWAIQCRQKGNSVDYYTLCDAISKVGRRSSGSGSNDSEKAALQKEELGLWIKAFSLCVSSLTIQCQGLVQKILSISWISSQDEEFVLNYTHFLEVLVSAQSVHAPAVAKMLVTLFRFDGENTTATEHYPRIHTSLSKILRIIPTGPSFLMPILTQSFPHKTEDGSGHCSYIKNILQVVEYTPELRHSIWYLIIERTIQIDTEIQIELEDMDDEDWNDFQQVDLEHYRDPENPFEDDSEKSDSSDIDEVLSDDEASLHPLSLDVRKLVQKLDAILQILFEYFGEQLSSTNPDRKSLYESLLVIFNAVVLPTHRLRCTQFLVFFASSLDSSFPDDLMGLLAGQIFAQGQPTILRITAASYLGSYIARAKFVDGQAVKTCMKLLVHYAVQYLDRHESSVNQKTMSKHGTFYAIVQAILYVFCFRWRDIVSSDHPKGQLPLEMAGFKRILTSQLIPFKVCSVHIVDEFARLTHELDILYCYPFMSRDSTSKWRDEERNSKVSEKDVNSSKSNGADLAATILDRLDTFFPFDPLTLPKSKKFMEGLYQEWESNDSDSESEQGGDEGEVDEHQVDEMAFSLEGTLSIE